MLIIVSAPSGAGKTSLVRELLQSPPPGIPLSLSVSCTTRSPRPGEIDGVHYHFLDRPAFEAQRQRGEFLEWAEVHGNLYGTSAVRLREALNAGKVVILEIDWQGAEQVRRLVPAAERTSIFILPPSMAELERRLRGRGQDTDDVIAARLAAAQAEMSHAGEFDVQLVNDDFAATLAALRDWVGRHAKSAQQR